MVYPENFAHGTEHLKINGAKSSKMNWTASVSHKECLLPIVSLVLPERLLGDVRTGEMEGVRDEEYGLCRSLSMVEDEATKWYCDHPSCRRTRRKENHPWRRHMSPIIFLPISAKGTFPHAWFWAGCWSWTRWPKSKDVCMEKWEGVGEACLSFQES